MPGQREAAQAAAGPALALFGLVVIGALSVWNVRAAMLIGIVLTTLAVSSQIGRDLLATLTAWCEQNNIPYQGVPVGSIKKHATGRGNADKQAMVASMQLLGHPVTDDNEADALALLHWALEADK